MIRLIAALIWSLVLGGIATAQPVSVVGPITPGNCPKFNSTTILADSGTPCGSNIFASTNTWTGINSFVRPGSTLTDLSSWALRWTGFAADLDGNVGPRYNIVIQDTVPGPTGYPSYQVSSILIQGRTNDPSSLIVNRDYAAIDVRGIISGGNLTGRAWGLITFGWAEAGADGLLVSHENAVVNFGTAQPLVNTITSKYNSNYTSTGTNPITAAIIAGAGGPGWYKWMYVDPASLVADPVNGKFIELAGKWTVNRDGVTDVGGSTLPDQLSVQAQASAGLAIGIRGRASDGTALIRFLSNDTLTLYGQFASDGIANEILAANTIAGSVDATYNLGKTSNAWLNTFTRNLVLNGSTAQSVTQTVQATAGNATVTWGTSSGTPAISVPSPLSLSSATGAVTWAALTSGGVLYASSTTTVAISALLTANQIVLGGGVGTAPSTLGSLGTATTVLHGNAGGAPTFGAVVSADLNITTTTCTNQFVSVISAAGVGTCSTVSLTALATQATNTVLGNATAGTAVPTALAVGTCSTAASALIWTTNTGFGCNTSITAATLSAVLAMSLGGLNANLTASNGGIVYSTASAGAILAGTATARQMLQSGASTTPAWSTTTWPATTTINRILWSSAANVISDLATANSSVLVTDSGGVPSLSTTLPAFTAGGTISGNGQQLNNIIIGTTTPLAGSFTVATVVHPTESVINLRAAAGTGGFAFGRSLNNDNANDFFIFDNAAPATRLTISSAGAVQIVTTTDATSTTTGALQVPGGASFNKRIWMSGLSAASAGLSAACVENTGEITSNTGVTTCLVSAREWKTNIRALPDASSNLLMAMRPRLFDWRDPSNGTPDQIGFIADEVASVDARLGVKGRVLGKDGVWSSWRVEMVTTLLVQGYQHHDDKLKNLQADNDNLRADIDKLKRNAAR